jgi:hypothetical protein
MSNPFLQGAIDIAEDILSRTIKEDTGWAWETMNWTEEKGVQWGTGEGIYSGVAGIALFMLELYKQTKESKYLEASEKAMEWTDSYCRSNPGYYFAFVTGRLGVPYVMMELYKVTGKEHYKGRAIEIALESDKALSSSMLIEDFINGTSGMLVALLHLHQQTGDERLLEKIDLFADHLLKAAHTGPEGLYWDKSNKQIRGLCGFSHGAAGIGFAFLELGHYFGNEAYYWVAEQAFSYENYFYSEQNYNWPDFRKGIFSPKDYENHKQEFLSRNIEFFTKPSSMLAWCHGAPGIGLSRLRAFELLGDEQYKKDLWNAIEATDKTSVHYEKSYTSYTLCHGGGGNAMLFIDAYRSLKDEKLLEMAHKVGHNALASKKKDGVYLPGLSQAGKVEDLSLFMGNAGVGYFYLQCVDPVNVPSVLAPPVKGVFKGSVSTYPAISRSLAEIKKLVLRKDFARTLELFEKTNTSLLVSFLVEKTSGRENIKKRFVAFAEKNSAGLSSAEQLKDVLLLEKEKNEMSDSMQSCALLHIERDVLYNKASETISSRDLKAVKLNISPSVKIKTTNWNWSPGSEHANLQAPPDEHPVLLKPLPERIVEEYLSPFTHVVLGLFEEPKEVGPAMEEILDNFEFENEAEKETTQNLISQQIKEAFVSGILVESENN